MATSTDLRAAIEEVQNQLPEDELAVGEMPLDQDLASRIEQRVGALPWWVISAVVHAVIFLLATLIGVALPPPNTDNVTIAADVAERKEPEYDPQKKRDLFKNPHEVQAEKEVENPVVVHEQVEVTDHFETDNDMDSQTARGHEDAISDIPLGGTGVTGVMGVGGGGMAGCFGYRDGGGRKKAVARFGGSPATESAVEAALRWLARHQEKNGSWNIKKYATHRKCTNLRCRVGGTALALLAFLGAGHTEKAGKFKDNVQRAQAWLIKRQKANGLISEGVGRGHTTAAGYNHSIAGLALAESYGMAKNPEVREVAQKAVDYSIDVHQKPYGGWRYDPKKSQDTSVSGWFVMQLKSARIAGLRVDNAGFQGAANFINKMTRKGGRVSYDGRKRPSVAMTAVGMVCRQFMGVPNTDDNLTQGAGFLRQCTPRWEDPRRKFGRERGFYYWYYGTLCMFQQGGKSWEAWNKDMKTTLLQHQRKGGPMDGSVNDVDGSWDPHSWIDKHGGRVMTTAMGALTLEVYYRYLPMFSK